MLTWWVNALDIQKQNTTEHNYLNYLGLLWHMVACSSQNSFDIKYHWDWHLVCYGTQDSAGHFALIFPTFTSHAICGLLFRFICSPLLGLKKTRDSPYLIMAVWKSSKLFTVLKQIISLCKENTNQTLVSSRLLCNIQEADKLTCQSNFIFCCYSHIHM